MRYILFFLLPFSLFATSDFITPMEYASQLYKNPRGIGCQECHGDKGEGRLIATYIHKNKKKSFRGPRINNVSFEEFYSTLNRRTKGMPRYFLTDQEIQALYLYLHPKKEKHVQ